MSPCTPEEYGQEARNGNTAIESFDWDEREAVALAVVETVATFTGKDTTELEPLSLTIDTDALNELFDPTGKSDRGAGYVQFAYEGCLIEVSADGTLAVTELEA